MLVVTTYIYTSCYRNINFIITKSVFSNHKLSRGKMEIPSNLQSKLNSEKFPDRSTPQNLGSGGMTFRRSELGWQNGAFRKVRKTFFCGNCVSNQAYLPKESRTNTDEKKREKTLLFHVFTTTNANLHYHKVYKVFPC